MTKMLPLPLSGASSMLPLSGASSMLPLSGASSMVPPSDNWRLFTVRAAAVLINTTVDLKMHSDTWNRWEEKRGFRIDAVDARGVELSRGNEDISLASNADGTLESRSSVRPVLYMRSTSPLGQAGFPDLTL